VGTQHDADRLVAHQREIAALLRHLVALSAMKYGRAPLPVSRSLLKAWMHPDFSGSPGDLEILIRRYLFFGDERLVLGELRMKPEALRTIGPILPAPAGTMPSCSGAA